MTRWSLFLPLLAAGAALGPLTAQQVDTTQAADSLGAPAFSWVSRLVPLMQDATKPYRLHLPWDEWGHSDLAATAANPFVTADLQVGAVRLDGSLGQPILSAVIPSAVTEDDGASGPGTALSSDVLTFIIAPLQDRTRTNQTFFSWDQGDYSYKDVQVGGAVQLDESRNITIAGQTRSHPGQYALAGPSPNQYESSVLQNYMLDYRRRIWPSMDFNYTLLHQREQVGLPVIEGGRLTADRRRNHTWTHGFRLEKTFTSWTIRLHGASMVSDLRTTTDGVDQAHLSRRSLSFWGGGELACRLTTQWQLVGKWQSKQRHIADDTLGYHSLSWNHGRLGTRRERGKWSSYGGLAVINGRPVPEGWIAAGSEQANLTFGTEATSFFDYPHRGRRITLDTTVWLPDPIYLRRTTLAFQASGARGHISARLAQLSTDDGRTAATGGLALDWTPWKDVLRLHGALTAVSSPDTLLFPTRINALAELTFTLPLRRTRARPFVSANASFISNEFARWLDPRFADSTPYRNPPENTHTAVLWVNGEIGLKVANFELRFRIYNVFGNLIQNSPEYLESGTIKHYSLSWRFLPQAK